MISKDATYAILWASNNTEKYGYKVFKDLFDAGYKVIPINPNEKKILNQKVFPNISTYDKKIDVVILVVPPKVTESLLPEILHKEISTVRMQPWSESDTAINFCKQNKMNYVANACIMIEKQKK